MDPSDAFEKCSSMLGGMWVLGPVFVPLSMAEETAQVQGEFING